MLAKVQTIGLGYYAGLQGIKLGFGEWLVDYRYLTRNVLCLKLNRMKQK